MFRGSGSSSGFYNIPRTTFTPTKTGGNDLFAPGPKTAETGVPYADLAAALNAFMTQQAAAPYIANLPNYQGMLGQATANAGSQLRGEIPRDVINQIQQAGAERGIATGMPGSPNANAAYLRALGLTSIGQQQTGATNLHNLIADTPVPQLFNPASLFVPERLANQELGAAVAGRNSIPSYPSGNAYSPVPVSRWGSAAGATGWGTPSGGTPALNPWAGPQSGVTQSNAGDDWLAQLLADESGMDWTGYSPFGNQNQPLFDYNTDYENYA